eukprot:GHVU01158230.1.p1 GENE.GHVU01158230.1~~GHVU01158230.1.p1  ORF type:complete len:115 (-),score=11.74 GHVU01158230.1:84-428(-)
MTMSQQYLRPTDIAGTWNYIAPECFKPQPKITTKADIWALGCILNELLGGGPPFDGCSLHEIFCSLDANRGPSIPDTMPEKVKKIVKRCLCIDVNKRATAAEVVSLLQASDSLE